MKTILKSMVALSLVSSVAFGAMVYKRDGNGGYKEVDVKFDKDNGSKTDGFNNYEMLKKFAMEYEIKYEYGKDENNIERIMVVMRNGEKAILEYINWNTDADGEFYAGDSELWVKKDGKKGKIAGYCEEFKTGKNNEILECLKPTSEFQEYDYGNLLKK